MGQDRKDRPSGRQARDGQATGSRRPAREGGASGSGRQPRDGYGAGSGRPPAEGRGHGTGRSPAADRFRGESRPGREQGRAGGFGSWQRRDETSPGRSKGFDARKDPRLDDQMVVYGIHPVSEFITVRPKQIRHILLDRRTPPGAIDAARRAAGLGIPVREAAAGEFEELVGPANAQGIVAILRPMEPVDGDDLIDSVLAAGEGLLVALDSIQDPQNLGSILRTAAFFGAAGVIITKDRSVRLTSSAVRASAGGAARVPVGEVTNLARALGRCVDAGMTVVGTVVSRGRPLSEVPASGPRVIVLGSEGAGMRRLVSESCSMLVTIPSPGGFESLNVGVTAGIMLCAASGQVPQASRPPEPSED